MTSTTEISAAKFIPLLSSSPPPLTDSIQDLDQSFDEFEVSSRISLPEDDLCENVGLYNETPHNNNYDNESLTNPNSSLFEKNLLPNTEKENTLEAHTSNTLEHSQISNDADNSLNVEPEFESITNDSENRIQLEEKTNDIVHSQTTLDSNDQTISGCENIENKKNDCDKNFQHKNMDFPEFTNKNTNAVNITEISSNLSHVNDIEIINDFTEPIKEPCSSDITTIVNDNNQSDCNEFGDFSVFQSASDFDEIMNSDTSVEQNDSNSFLDFSCVQSEPINEKNVPSNIDHDNQISDDGFGSFDCNLDYVDNDNVLTESNSYDKNEDPNARHELKEISENNSSDTKVMEESEILALDTRTACETFAPECDEFDDDFGAFNDAASADEFGDFATVQENSSENNFAKFLPDKNNDDFAEFGEFGTSDTKDSDDWAVDFQSSEAISIEDSEKETAQKNIWDTIKNAFSNPELSSEMDVIVEPIDVVAIDSDKKSTSCRIFHKLRDIEDSKSLNLQWTCLKSNNFLLKALDIDSRNILFGQNRNPSIPIFASNLGLLEPTKPCENFTKRKENQIEDYNSETDHSSQPPSPTQVENIPPVQFDWSVSGLTNPLESLSSSTSTLLDLEIFMSSNSSVPTSNSKSSSLEDEFLSSPSPELTSTSTSVLDKLMSSVKQTTFIPQGFAKKRPTGLSDEAIQVLNRLVPLSFMNAKVLMFPVSSQIPEQCP